MHTLELESPIITICVKATSYPEGITEAHEKLRQVVPFRNGRRFFGISHSDRQDPGKILYFSAAEQLTPGEGRTLGLGTFVIRKGSYRFIDVPHFRKSLSSVSEAFEELLELPELDPTGYCLEMYPNETDIRCCVLITG